MQHLFAQATAAHAAGDLARAQALYQNILAITPDHPDALHLLGRLALDAGQTQPALDLIGRAIRVRPRIAEYQASLADAQRAAGQPAEAAETLRRAVRLKPESAPIQLAHGLALAERGDRALAIQAFRRAIARDRTLAAAHRALGAALLAEGQFAAAADAFRVTTQLAPNDAEARFNLGAALQHHGDLPAAEQHFRAALTLRPAYPEAANNLGLVLQSAGRLTEAADWLQRAISLNPNAARQFINLGLVLRDASRFAEAEAAFRQAEALAPTAETLCCIGNTLRDQGRLAEAEAALTAALTRDPAHGESRFALAATRLLQGDYAAAWPDFDWRAGAATGRALFTNGITAPRWQSEPLNGTLLIYAEQGAGDFLQMARYIPLAAARATSVLLMVPPALRRLADGLADTICPGEPLPPLAVICADMDLPGIFRTTPGTIPAAPYLTANPAETAAWTATLAAAPGRKIGLAWSGNPAYFHDRQRSLPSGALSPLGGLHNVTFVALQPGPLPAGLPMLDHTASLTDFAATAALIAALDLVISVDTAVAHLAGALGRPVWLLNRFAPDWRWGLGHDGSAWYPTMRQFRQATPGEWDSVITRVKEALLF